MRNDDGSEHVFETVVARTAEDKARGLMHVRKLRTNQSMTFLWETESRRSFYMRDTYLSLDMWFVSAEGVILSIARNTEPHSLESISPDVRAKAVIEVNAGVSQKLGISVGSVVQHESFKNVP